jgi:hypothetical protein
MATHEYFHDFLCIFNRFDIIGGMILEGVRADNVICDLHKLPSGVLHQRAAYGSDLFQVIGYICASQKTAGEGPRQVIDYLNLESAQADMAA